MTQPKSRRPTTTVRMSDKVGGRYLFKNLSKIIDSDHDLSDLFSDTLANTGQGLAFVLSCTAMVYDTGFSLLNGSISENLYTTKGDNQTDDAARVPLQQVPR